MRQEVAEQFCKELMLTYIKAGKIPDDAIIQDTVSKAVRSYHIALETIQEANKERRDSKNSKLRIY